MGRGGRGARWVAWVLGLALLVGLPLAWQQRPTSAPDLTADRVVDLLRGAEGRPYSGLVQTTGTLQLPSVDDFDGVAALFGGPSRLRVWWRGDDAWRVDRLSLAGEEDLVHDGTTTTTWDYEALRARTSRDPDIRLPRASDLLPPALAERALTGEVTATPLEARRVAGVDAVGVRVRPASDASAVDHVDVWVDPASGVALEVAVWGEGAATPSFTSRFETFSDATPEESTTTFDAPAEADVSFEDTLDIADAANQYAPLRPPSSVAGLAKAPSSDGAVGVYGEGLAQLIAIPLRDDDADALREQLLRIPGSQQVTASPRSGGVAGTVASVEVLGVALTGTEGDGGYLLAGTVTPAVLRDAMTDVVLGARYVEDPS